MPDAVEAYLKSLNTSDRARAAAFDAVYNMDDAAAEATLKSLPFSDAVRAKLWDARTGTMPAVETPTTPPVRSSRLSDPGLRAEFDKFDAANRRVYDATLGKVWKGVRRVIAGPTWDERAGGLADVAVGAGTTAAGLFAPQLLSAAAAAPILTGGMLVGGTIGANVAREGAERMGAGPGGQALAEVAGGAVGGGAGLRGARPVSRAVGRTLRSGGERLYRMAGFRETPVEARAAMEAVASGQPAPQSQAGAVMARGVAGTPTEIGAQFLRRLDVVHPRLLASAGRRVVPNLQNRERVADVLDMVAADVSDMPYASGDISDEARRLATVFRSSSAPMATDALKAKILLDKARLSSSYKLNPNLSARQSELMRASDDVRRAFHRADPGLSALLSDERVAMRGLESMVDKAVKDGNRELVQALDPLIASSGAIAAGPAGALTPAARRALQSTSLMTRAGRSMYRMGGGQPVGVPPEVGELPNAGLLTAGARPMPAAPDPSFARGVPAEAARREPAGLLTAGSGSEHGTPTRLGPTGQREPGGLAWFDDTEAARPTRGQIVQPSPAAPAPARPVSPTPPQTQAAEPVTLTAAEASRATSAPGQPGRRVKIVPPAKATPKAAPAPPSATPERAAQHVTDELARVVNVDGARSAKDVQARVITALNDELAEATTRAGFAEAAAKRFGKSVSGYVDGKRVVDVDSLGQVRETGGRIPAFRDMGPKEQERAVAALAAKLAGDANKAGSVSIKIPGDGTFTVARNPHALAEVIRRVTSGGPTPWKGIVGPKK